MSPVILDALDALALPFGAPSRLDCAGAQSLRIIAYICAVLSDEGRFRRRLEAGRDAAPSPSSHDGVSGLSASRSLARSGCATRPWRRPRPSFPPEGPARLMPPKRFVFGRRLGARGARFEPARGAARKRLGRSDPKVLEHRSARPGVNTPRRGARRSRRRRSGPSRPFRRATPSSRGTECVPRSPSVFEGRKAQGITRAEGSRERSSVCA
jgi:hypothetical protein